MSAFYRRSHGILVNTDAIGVSPDSIISPIESSLNSDYNHFVTSKSFKVP